MINQGYLLTIDDSDELKKFKKSAAYGTYLKSISISPAFTEIMKEHIKNVDVTEDINILKNSGKIPNEANSKVISDLFKQALSKMAICIVADSIILKELETIKLKEVIDDLSAEADVNYLLGKADKKFYEQAAKLVQEKKLSENSLGYRGLVSYIKQNGGIETLKINSSTEIPKPKTISKQEKTELKTDSLDKDEVIL